MELSHTEVIIKKYPSPIHRILYFHTNEEPTGPNKIFIDYVIRVTGKTIVKNKGFSDILSRHECRGLLVSPFLASTGCMVQCCLNKELILNIFKDSFDIRITNISIKLSGTAEMSTWISFSKIRFLLE